MAVLKILILFLIFGNQETRESLNIILKKYLLSIHVTATTANLKKDKFRFSNYHSLANFAA
jgi:hypothetical protein